MVLHPVFSWHWKTQMVTLMHCASYHPHDICGDELGGRSASISKARQQGMVFCSSHHDPWASNDQLWSKKTYHRKGSLESFRYHSAILHGNHFTFPSQKLFSILSLSLPQSKGLCSSQVHPNCGFSVAFFTQDSLFTYKFFKQTTVALGQKTGVWLLDCLFSAFFWAAVILLPGSKVKIIMMDLQREDASAVSADEGISWWLNQPICKICTSKRESSPNRGENTVFETTPTSRCVHGPYVVRSPVISSCWSLLQY